MLIGGTIYDLDIHLMDSHHFNINLVLKIE